MSNTTKVSGRQIMITGLDADWNIDTDMPGYDAGLKIISIVFVPSATGDIMVIRNSKAGTATDAEMFRVKVTGDTDQRIEYYYGNVLFPFIDISECTLGTAANARVLINFA